MQASRSKGFKIVAMTNSVPSDDLSREVYGVLGIPIDAVDMAIVLQKIDAAAAAAMPFLISTANLNFLVTSRSDEEFRESLLRSDLCTADGMPIVWMARLLGVPVKGRIAGSDIFEAIKSAKNKLRLKVFLFGGAEGAAAAACSKLNAEAGGMTCSGSYSPGFGTLDEMSTDEILSIINSSNANFLAAALGAKKGQAWLLRNHYRFRVPVRVHLGATINFQAGTLKRAPARMRKWGLEWLWRIKEEPHLWRRYWDDGLALLRLVLTQVIPLVVLHYWYRLKLGGKSQYLRVERTDDHKSVILSIDGVATAQNIGNAVTSFLDAASAARSIVINFTNIRLIDARFLGLLLMLDKQLKRQHLQLKLAGISPPIARIFRLNGFEFLLQTNTESVA